MELPEGDPCYDSDGAGPCTQPSWTLLPSPWEEALPASCYMSEGAEKLSASLPMGASQAVLEDVSILVGCHQLVEKDSLAEKGACELLPFAGLTGEEFAVKVSESCSGVEMPLESTEVQGLGNEIIEPFTQKFQPISPSELERDREGVAKKQKRADAGLADIKTPQVSQLPSTSVAAQDEGAVKTTFGGPKDLLNKAPSSSGLREKGFGRCSGVSLEGFITAVSPVVDIGAGGKSKGERKSFFLVELQVLECGPSETLVKGLIAKSERCKQRTFSEAGTEGGRLTSAEGTGEQPTSVTSAVPGQRADQPAGVMSAIPRAFLYFEGESALERRRTFVSHAGERVRLSELKRRTMVGKRGGGERMVYIAGGKFDMTWRPGDCESDGTAGESNGHRVCISVDGYSMGVQRSEGARGERVQFGGVGQAEESPPQEEAKGTERAQSKRHGGISELGEQRSSEAFKCRKGLPLTGTLCYVGTVTAVWSSGLVVELDRRLTLLLTHYPETEIPGLRVGSLLATWHVHPIARNGQVVALGACSHSLVTILGSPNWAGLEGGLAGREHPLRRLCDRLPFSVALWVAELERSLQLKLGGDSAGRLFNTFSGASERGPSLWFKVPGTHGRSNTAPKTGFAKPGASEEAPFTAASAAGVAWNRFPTTESSPREHLPFPESGFARLSDNAECTDLVRKVATQFLPGLRDLRQHRDVFPEFMSHDTACKLGVDPPGWKSPPQVLPISVLLGRICKGQDWAAGLSSKELGSALLGRLEVDADSGRAVLADATGSVRIRVREQLQAAHLGRWYLVTNFTWFTLTAEVPGGNRPEPWRPEPWVSFNLTDALIIFPAPGLPSPPRNLPKLPAKTLAVPNAYGSGTWLRPDGSKGAHESNLCGRDAATWQNGGRTAWQAMGGSRSGGYNANGGAKERAWGTPYWMVVIVSKSELMRTETGFRYVAETVLLPRVLRVLGSGGALVPGRRFHPASKSWGSTSGQFRVPQTPQAQLQNPQISHPQSGLVQSYHRITANEARQSSGPPWLMGRAGIPQCPIERADGCLFTPAWERSHRPVHTGLTRPLVKCGGKSPPAPKLAAPGGACSLDVVAREKAVLDKTLGPEQLPAGAASGAVSNGVSLNQALSGHTSESAVRKASSAGPCPSAGAAHQSRTFYARAGHRASTGTGRGAAVGAAAAARFSNARPSKRPKPFGVENSCTGSAESVQCSVYSQRLGDQGRADQELERGLPLGAVLERRGPVGIGGCEGGSEAVGPGARVMLMFTSEAALLYDVTHVGASCLVPAPCSTPDPVDIDSRSGGSVLPRPEHPYQRLPVIDLVDRDAVRSFRFVDSDAATDSEETATSSGQTVGSGKAAQASVLVEAPGWVCWEVKPFLGDSLPAERPGKSAIGPPVACRNIETVRLRGKVAAVLELELAWGCPFCGARSSSAPDVWTLRSGCVSCCADETVYTVLLHEACFAFDDGASQCEVWAEGPAAADLLSLPYVAATAQRNSFAQASATPSMSNVTGSSISIGDSRTLIQAGQTNPSITVDDSANTGSKSATARSSSNPSKLQCDGAGVSPRQQAAGVTSYDAVGRLRTDGLYSAREAILESVNKRQRQGTSRAALYEPSALFPHLHRCLLDSLKLEALVRREGMVRVRTNPEGAADGSFLAAQREMTGQRTGQLAGQDREALEVLVGRACRQSQKILTCSRLARPPSDRSRFLSKEQSAAVGRGRCRVYLSGQVYEIYAPAVAAFRVLKVEQVSPSVEAAALCRQLIEGGVG